MHNTIIALTVSSLVSGAALVNAGNIYPATPSSTITLKKGAKYSSVHTGDINNDGIKDILVSIYANGLPSGFVAGYCQKGNGQFASKPFVIIPIKDPRGAVIKDIDGDGKNDIAVNMFRKRLYLCYAKKHFKPLEYVDTNMRSNDLLNVQLNSSLAAKTSISLLGRAVWWRVLRDGTVKQTYIARPPKNNSEFPAVGDLNDDGEMDLVYPQKDRLLLYFGPFSPVKVLRPKMLSEHSIIKKSSDIGAFRSVCIGDYNGDSKEDIAVNSDKTGIVFYFQHSPMGFGDKLSGKISGNFWRVKSVDLNNDKLKDLVTIDRNLRAVRIFLQKKDGEFVSTKDDADQVITGGKFYNIDIADLNSDGKKDLVVATHGNIVKIYLAQ